MRALASGNLQAKRDNHNAWQIEISDLEVWASDRPGQAPDQTKDNDRTISMDQSRTIYADTPETMARLAVAEARLTDVTAERDRLLGLLETALHRQPIIAPSIWSRLFRS